MGVRFNVGEVNSQNVKEISEKFNLSSLTAKVVSSRGIDAADLPKYLNPSLEDTWQNPNEIEGLSAVVDKLENAIREGKKILIFGDYDLDGISATTIMLRAFAEIHRHFESKFSATYYIPDRFNEGYGITPAAIQSLRKLDKPDLIVTVDCGISCKDEVVELRQYGVDVAITDHHESSDNIPQDVPWCDPKVSGGPSEVLCGAGVALKVVQALTSRFGLPHFWRELTDIATLGTIADIMPLTGENRALVTYGVKLINKQCRPSIASILEFANCECRSITSTDISWGVTPRLNSAGRMNKPHLAVRLLCEDDPNKAQQLAEELESLNTERKELTENLSKVVDSQARHLLQNNPNLRSIVLAGESWHEGVRGIVAAQVSGKYGIPTIIFTIDGDEAHGSGRSVGDIDIHAAILECKDLLERYGGHKGACGMSLKTNHLHEFAQRFDEYMQRFDAAEFEGSIHADCVAKASEMNLPNGQDLHKLEPFGAANEEPTFLIKNVFLSKARAIGADHNHLSCFISDGAQGCAAIKFNVSEIEKYIDNPRLAWVTAKLKIDEFRGNLTPKLYLDKIVFADDLEPEGDCDISKIFENIPLCEGPTAVGVGASIEQGVADASASVVAEASAKNKENFQSNKTNVRENSNSLEELASTRRKWEEVAQREPDKVRDQIVHAMIGEGGSLHDSQIATLNVLEQGKSALAVLPTGRGKSLIFQVFAAMIALRSHKTSLFVYPLRALIADQAYHLSNTFGKFGLTSVVLCGQTPADERPDIMEGLKNRAYDIVLTTPEYLDIHSTEIAQTAKIGFVVVDESHHIGEVRVGQRTAYGNFPRILSELNNPQVLALSATVNSEVYPEIKKYLPVNELITDDFERANLFIDDKRNIKAKDDYLCALVGSGQKTVIYANSREQTIALARMLKSWCPNVALKVGFYNAGMSKAQRKLIEDYFRDNKLSCLVATSAFGEGVNIPDIRHVCLYHLPFSDVEFNQMSGRAGRDGAPAIVHLLFSRADATINTNILQMANPTRDCLAKVYRWLKAGCASSPDDTFSFVNEMLLDMFNNNLSPAMPGAVLCSVAVFSELGLISTQSSYDDGKTVTQITLNETSKVNLEDSSRFVEGLHEIASFEAYRDFAMKATKDELTQILRHPITPSP